jgi:hypothetical protein
MKHIINTLNWSQVGGAPDIDPATVSFVRRKAQWADVCNQEKVLAQAAARVSLLVYLPHDDSTVVEYLVVDGTDVAPILKMVH